MKTTKQQEFKNRNQEQFYTADTCADMVLTATFDFLKQNKVQITSKNTFIEPSAGTGAFIKWLKKHKFNQIKAFDLDPKAKNIVKMDFYKLELPYKTGNIVVGNPPFGYKSCIAIDFLNKCLEFADIVIFILPVQFNRFNTQKQIKTSAKLIYNSLPLPKKSFIYKNKPHTVNCIYQIWVNDKPKFKNIPDIRVKTAPASKHPDFKTFIYNNTPTALKFFNKDLYKWDFAVVRQGYYDYTEIITDPSKLKKNRQYLFIKYINPRAREIFKHISFKELAESNTSIKGFSNTDLVAKYNELIDKLHL